MAVLKEGSKAPDFTLLTNAGEKLKLSSLAGRKVVLYFYPKADTRSEEHTSELQSH